jgi:glycosyltransferase involved in cell wall biosynthesis
MRILMIVSNQVGKGTYWRAFYLGRALVQRGHSVMLMAMSPKARWRLREQTVDNLLIVETPDCLRGSLRSGWDPWDTCRRLMWLNKRSFDLVHAFEARPVIIFPALAAKRRGAKLVMDWCDWFGRGGSVEERPTALAKAVLRPVETFFEERFRTRADGTTVINTVLRKKALELGVSEADILLLPNGAPLDVIRPGDRRAARQRLGLPQDALLIAYTGALFFRDAELMAAAFDRIAEAEPRARLLLMSYSTLPVARMVHAQEAVWSMGPFSQSELSDYLVACDVAWLPLRDTNANRGRFPLKLTDYMAAGLPTVATDVGEIGDLLREETVGVLTADDAEKLADAVLSLLGDASRCHDLGHRARQVAEARFSWPAIAERTEQFYEAIVGCNAIHPV